MRRATLKKVLGTKSVDAMHPEPDIKNIDATYINLYKHWNNPYWRHAKKLPYLIPSAVKIRGKARANYQKYQYGIVDPEETNLVVAFIDLNRRDTRIISDFQEALISLRKDHPERARSNPRIQDWHLSCILEIWDLREYRVPWSEIVKVLSSNVVNSIQQARNSFNSAKNYIDQNQWKTLVRNYIS